ncbi:unnamed protein product [Effrenium voratum]|uniref:EF-hand domain-containing protein n=1 Tax=Effrenium voratum TaxID=2562239 RepID=A0AA36JEB4_9DINO|nr:unnamed protein product [Effrenium voratum]
MVNEGLIKTYPPSSTSKRSRHATSDSLARAGWSQVCKTPSAPADTRFVRVPGGWRPRVRPVAEEHNSPRTAHEDASPCWDLRQQTMHRDASQSTLTSSAGVGARTSRGCLALLRPDGFEREKRPYRRDPHLAKELHLWPAKFLEEREKNVNSLAATKFDPLDTALEELKTMLQPKRDSSVSSRRSSPASRAASAHGMHGPHGRRLSMRRISGGELAERLLRRASATSVGAATSSNSETDSSGDDAFAAARLAAEEAYAEAEKQGLPPTMCRQRRQEVYAEALLMQPEIVELQAGRMRGGSGLEEDEVESEVEKLIKEDIAELAQLFAEFDGSLEGVIQQHDFRSLLRLLGRTLTEDEVRGLLNCLDPLDPDETEVRGDVGFREFVELCDMRLHSEKQYLRSFYRERFRGASSNCIQPHLRDVTDALQGVKVHARPEQVERTALELGFPVWAEFITLEHETDLFVLAQRCRMLEKQRAWERAGFTLEQVSRFQQLYDHFVAKTGRGVRSEELLYIVHQLGIVPKGRSDEVDLEATAFNGKDRTEAMSLEECMHSARRFVDKKDMDARSKELRAADISGIPQEELDCFRAFYRQLIAEDTQGNKKDFTYFALVRGVQIMGATLTVERNAELEQMFKEHAVSSVISPFLHLPFPKFIVMIGTLFKLDFAGLRSTAARNEEEASHLRRMSKFKAVGTRPLAMAFWIPRYCQFALSSPHDAMPI